MNNNDDSFDEEEEDNFEILPVLLLFQYWMATVGTSWSELGVVDCLVTQGITVVKKQYP